MRHHQKSFRLVVMVLVVGQRWMKRTTLAAKPDVVMLHLPMMLGLLELLELLELLVLLV